MSPAPRFVGPQDRADRDVTATRITKAAWIFLGLLAALLVAYLCFLVLRSSWSFRTWLDGWFVVAFEGIAALMCFANGVLYPRLRAVAFTMGAACALWTSGDAVVTLQSLNGGSVPSPSIADIGYLAFFPLAFVAILLFTRKEVIRGTALNWLDGAIAAVGTAAICAAFAFHGFVALFGTGSIADALNAAFPLGDVLLLGLVTGSAVVVSGRAQATLVLVAIGMAVNAAGDTANFVGSSSTIPLIVNAIAWPTSMLVFATAIWVGGSNSSRVPLPTISGFLLPGIVTVASLGVLIAGSAYEFGPLAIALASATLVLAGAAGFPASPAACSGAAALLGAALPAAVREQPAADGALRLGHTARSSPSATPWWPTTASRARSCVR